MITLKFIWHDCFVLETPAFAAVFDFWKDGRRSAASGEPPAFLSSIPEDKPLYVLVSHHHKDHFHRSIFNWEQVHPEIRFIISKDTCLLYTSDAADEAYYVFWWVGGG